jgi:gas vesicle protein
MAGTVDQSHRTRGLFDNVQPNCLVLELTVEDRDTVDELCAYSQGPEREAFALNALRIGVLALRQARGRMDVDLIQRETQRMLTGLQSQLDAHSLQMHDRLAGSLKEYFDPHSGRFNERVQQLVKQDGDLEQVLRRQIGGTDSELARTLVSHVGEQSPLLKLLDPNQSRGLLQALREMVEGQLTAQRNHVLREFSLDNKEGALARLVGELSNNHGQIAKSLGDKIDAVVREFSLDEENSALSRLVRNVDRAQRTISSEFSLDNENSALSRLSGMLDSTKKAIDGQLTLDGETSALARLRRELLAILDTHAKSNGEFQEEVKVTLAKMVARREEAAKSTRHGLAFEDAVCAFIEFHCQHNGDVAERTGQHTGLIKNCKVGDVVIHLGPESAAPGAKIAIEAKEDASCTLARSRLEIETARKNRDGQIGLFVLSKRSACEGTEEVQRYGEDVFVVWDPDDCSTNLHLKAGLTIARALCIRAERQSEAQTADFEAITEAILEVEKQSNFLGEISKATDTIRTQSDKILERVRKSRASLERQVETLRDRMADLKQSFGAAS